jgi:hypothetical protein
MQRGLQGILAVLALFMVAVAAGCGGGGTGTDATETAANGNQVRLQKYHFVFHASIICKKGLEQADVAMHRAAGKPIPQQPSSAPDWQSVKLPVKVVLPAFKRIATQLEALEPPEADAYDYGNFLSRLRGELKQAEADPDAPISSRPLAGAGKVAYVWGLHACLF